MRFFLLLFLSLNVFATDFNQLQEDYLNGNYKKVLEVSENSVNEKEGKVFILTYQAYAAMSLEQFDVAEKKLSLLEKLKANSANLNHLKVYLMVKMNKADKALKELELLKKQNEINDDEKLILLNLYMQSEKYAKAAKLVKNLSPQQKKMARVQQIMGYLAFVQQRFKTSLYHYKRAIALKSQDPNNFLALETIYGQLSRDKEQISILKEGLKNNPHNYYLLSHLAYQLEVNGELSQALEYYEKALVYASDSEKPFIQSALRRLNNQKNFNSFTQVRVSNDQIFNNVLSFYNNDLEARSLQQSFQQRLGQYWTLGFDYLQNSHEKKLETENHKITDQQYSLRTSFKSPSFMFQLTLGKMDYEANNIGEGTSGENDELTRSALFTYSRGQNHLSISHSSRWETEDYEDYLLIQEVRNFSIQDTYSFNGNFTLLGSIANSQTDNYQFNQLTLNPTYYLTSVPGLSVFLNFDMFDYENQKDYFQYFLGGNYDRSLNDDFIFSFTIDLGRREVFDTTFLRWNSLVRYYVTDFHSLIFGAGATHTKSDFGKDDTLNVSVALDLNF